MFRNRSERRSVLTCESTGLGNGRNLSRVLLNDNEKGIIGHGDVDTEVGRLSRLSTMSEYNSQSSCGLVGLKKHLSRYQLPCHLMLYIVASW